MNLFYFCHVLPNLACFGRKVNTFQVKDVFFCSKINTRICKQPQNFSGCDEEIQGSRLFQRSDTEAREERTQRSLSRSQHIFTQRFASRMYFLSLLFSLFLNLKAKNCGENNKLTTLLKTLQFLINQFL